MIVIKREVRRFIDRDGKTLFFAVYLGTRRAGWRFFRPPDVPDFEGETAAFEVEVRKGQWVFGERLR